MNNGKGTLCIVGIGPGENGHCTGEAYAVLEGAHIVVGYKGYLKQISSIIAGKEQFTTGMGAEKERAAEAVRLAGLGKKVAVVSGGDPGVYGMAGLILESMDENDRSRIDVSIVPGVTAANAAASLLGAPLMNDYAVISLSDLLTDRELILRRLRSAAEGDFVTVLYNPKSKKRVEILRMAIDIFLSRRTQGTPAAVVTNALREGERVQLSSLGGLDPESSSIGMSSVVIIGNSSSFQKGPWFITPRGYKL